MGKTRTKLVEEKDKAAAKGKTSHRGEGEKEAKKKTLINLGKFYIRPNLNNTIISFTDHQGNVIAQSSSGAAGFKNTRKGTPYAGAKAMESLINKLNRFEISEAKVIVRGIGPGRESAIRVLFNSNFNLTSVEDRTPIPFGGPKPKKARRV